jgi:integrase
MSPRARHYGVRKVCGCPWKRWPKCPHPWHFSYKPRGGARYRFSLDVELNQHIGSKTEAEKIANDIRTAIHAGTFQRAASVLATSPAPAPAVVTLDSFATTYIKRASQASGKTSWRDDASLLATVRNHVTTDGRRLGDWPLTAITEDELEAVYAAQRAAGRAASTLNHLVQVLKAAFRWGARKGYLARSPISDGSALKRTKLAQRTRRITPDQETALLKVAGALSRGAGVRLSGLIVAALETGCRRGELLALRWADVDLDRHELVVRGETAKDNETRVVPISSRLAAVLEVAKTDPAGREVKPEAYVFGTFGQQVQNIRRAWETCVLQAYGHTPTYLTKTIGDKTVKTSNLAPESRAALAAIDLHFHDLRHEAGSRWLEAGVPLHHIKELLGHANISQTDTYLNAGRVALQESIKRFDASRETPEAKGTGDSRGKLVANKANTEHRPLCHDGSNEAAEDQVH